MATYPRTAERTASAPRTAGQAAGSPRTLPRAPFTRSSGVTRRFTARIPGLLLIAIALLAVSTVGVVQVLQTSQAATAGYELSALEVQAGQLSAEIRQLEADAARSSRLESVYAIATQRLGMVPPEETMRVAVDASAPRVVPLPERFVQRPPEPEHPGASWWSRLLETISTFP